MVNRVNKKTVRLISSLVTTGLLFFAFTSESQIFKKRQKKDNDRSEYAYKTFSTTQRKEKKKSFTGDEAKFHFDKPVAPVPYGIIDRPVDYSKAPYFGHKRPPHRRPPGSMKLCKVCGIKH